MKGENAVFGVHLSQSSLGLNSQVAIDPRQSMRSGFHFVLFYSFILGLKLFVILP